ncbi:FAD-binding oxidoreductase [Aquamicrobium sp. LC103]|uniref:FAD-binding oxidoreductase n=1 Tax=Aquamicrobium sp. LC103 TaxID=1120658 RepID=UPI00063EA175|nr:FAD-binding oxidoreductase [Aquamicrobium sp. LC103]TKT80062.1 FAD-binding oxidoreductase [Aquamicrobium sp. LC103]
MAPVYQSFGRTTSASRRAIPAQEAIRLLQTVPSGVSLLPYGNGRSYGDTCLNFEGTLVDMRTMNRILDFDAESGIIEAEAGTMLSDIIGHVAPHGFFPAVVPGTRHVTLGGAVANDIHGKNHHRRGTFGRHVVGLTLMRSDGIVYNCNAERNSELFAATIGGMGLTGLILTVSLRLMRVPSLMIEEKIRRFRSLSEYFELAEEADRHNEYAVAWVDQLAVGGKAGRGLLITGNHAASTGPTTARPGNFLSVPFQPPLNLLNRPFLRLFNEAYFRRKGRTEEMRATSAESFFFPLDSVAHWNRLYGPAGLMQHQSVIPAQAAPKAIPQMMERARAAGQGSFLTVLKRFGAIASPGILSFPRPGYTLTLDFSFKGTATRDLFTELDRITVEAGGAVNAYKDARMSAETFAASFPQWRRLARLRDPGFVSDFWNRTAMRLPRADAGGAMAAE